MKDERDFVSLKIGRNRFRKIFLDEILYLKADRAYTLVKTNNTQFVLTEPLKNFESIFKNCNYFIRVNRSYIISLKKCNEFKNCKKPEIIMEDEEIIYPKKDFLIHIIDYFDVGMN